MSGKTWACFLAIERNGTSSQGNLHVPKLTVGPDGWVGPLVTVWVRKQLQQILVRPPPAHRGRPFLAFR
jgi:hypothetical protein